MLTVFLVAIGLINLACLFFVIVQISNIVNALDDILSENNPQDSIQPVDYEDDLSLRLKEFQKMKFSGIDGKKNEK